MGKTCIANGITRKYNEGAPEHGVEFRPKDRGESEFTGSLGKTYDTVEPIAVGDGDGMKTESHRSLHEMLGR